MVKKIVILFVFCLLLSVNVVLAAPYLQDEAEIFNDRVTIENQLSELSDELGYPLYIVTTDQYYQYDDALTAADYLLANRVGFDNDGVMLAINMASRDVTVTSSGPHLQSDSISDRELIELRKKIGSYLSDGEYDEAALYYHDRLRRLLAGNYLSLTDIVIAALGAVFGVGAYGAKQLKNYNPKAKRKDFPLHKNAIVALDGPADRLLHSRDFVTVIPRNKSGGGGSTSHRTGGGSFRGSSGKF